MGGAPRVVGRLAPGEVRVDADGLLSFGPTRVVVPRIEATILNRLGASPERVVRRAELVDLVWPGCPPTVRALDSRIHTLRARVAPLGLQIHTIRARGFLLALRARPPASSRRPSPPPPGDLRRSHRWST